MQSWNTPYSTFTLKTDCFAQVKSNTTYIIAVVYIQAVFFIWNKEMEQKQQQKNCLNILGPVI